MSQQNPGMGDIIFEYVAWTGHPDTGPTQHDPPTQQILDSTYKIKELCLILVVQVG